MRFHQALSFMPTDELIPVARACQDLGYDGIYLSDHLFNPRERASRYTYSADGAPMYPIDTSWPDPMCVISALAAVTSTLTFTTGVYIAPVRDLITVAKTTATADVLSGGRLRLGVGVGWCAEEFAQTGQTFTTRGKRLDEMIPALRALWGGGWVEYHGTYYDVPACRMLPAPTAPIPILAGGHSPVAFRRAAQLCDGWIAAGAYSEAEAFEHLASLAKARADAGTDNASDFAIYISLAERPDRDLHARFEDAGVTDIVCAPWMFAPVPDDANPDERLAAHLASVTWFAEKFLG